MRQRPGNALLISLIVLSAMMLGFALLGATIASENVQNDASKEQKAIASASAQACMDLALQQLAVNISYAGNQNNDIDGTACTIRPIIHIGGQWNVDTSATFGRQTARYRTVLTGLNPLVVATQTELGSF